MLNIKHGTEGLSKTTEVSDGDAVLIFGPDEFTLLVPTMGPKQVVPDHVQIAAAVAMYSIANLETILAWYRVRMRDVA